MIANLLLLLYFEFISLNIFIIYPTIYLLNLFDKKLKKIYINSYFIGLVFIINWIYDVKLYVKNQDFIKNMFDKYQNNKHNDKYENKNNKNIFIQNHQTEFDFIIIMMVLSHYPEYIHNILFRFIMTEKVYYFFPGIGLGNILAGGSIITNNKNKNINRLNNMKLSEYESFFIFPEGFLSHKENKIKSDLYCNNNGYNIFPYTLYPKSTGIEILTKNNKIDYLYTLSVHYNNLKHFEKAYRIYNTEIPKTIFLEINKEKLDYDKDLCINDLCLKDLCIKDLCIKDLCIKDIVLNSFKKINESFDKKDYTNFMITNKNYTQLLCFIIHMCIFCFINYLFICNHIFFYLFLLNLFLYYFYIIFFI